MSVILIDFCDPCIEPLRRLESYNIFLELDELPSTYDEFKLMFPELFI